MGDVFEIAEGSGASFLRDAAIEAAYALGVLDALASGALGPSASGAHALDLIARRLDVRPRRLRLLLDALVGLGVLARLPAAGESSPGYRVVQRVPRPPSIEPTGWGALAEVIRRDRPQPAATGDVLGRMHAHLAAAGVAAADETARLLGRLARSGGGVDGPAARAGNDSGIGIGSGAPPGAASMHLVDLGGGAGAYTRAFLAAHPASRATLVDVDDVIPLAREHLAPFDDRVAFVAADIREAQVGGGSIALLANVVHLHGPDVCVQLVERAAHAVPPGGIVAIKDLRMDAAGSARTGPLQSLLFALNMGVYTDDGDVHETALLRDWLARAGLIDIAEHRLATSPHAIVVVGRKP